MVEKKVLNIIKGKLTLVTAHWVMMLGMFYSYSISWEDRISGIWAGEERVWLFGVFCLFGFLVG